MIERGGGFLLPQSSQIHIHRESILITRVKVSFYLRCLGISFPRQCVYWSG